MTELTARAVDGVRITARDEGRGPSLLIVPPGGTDAASWDAVARELDGFRAVRLQRRIYASGAPVVLPHRMSTEASDIQVIATQLAPPIIGVGHSSGAVALLESARLHSASFAGLILYEPPLPTTELVAGAAGVKARARIDAGDPVEAMRIHLRDIVGMPAPIVDMILTAPDARDQFVKHAAAQVADDEAIDALGLGIDRYRSLTMPVVLIEGSESPGHVRERSSDLASVLPMVLRKVTLANQGHVAHLTAPGMLGCVIREAALEIRGSMRGRVG
ncbi:alpha/beta fold hydrolase [Paramicrobacterium chengjingii]|uniref:Alpha/beta hydrolase n=1 Tax=Paramicrobacterium chengjingii TaxID=2769067 RepID=A0ABX6YIT0_9MICO|nr:alpha/beta hydrolase [Microbacterium chengjingii]QPZ38698.1 alpha/beta hydrolase [Microbacterium chengjingii]